MKINDYLAEPDSHLLIFQYMPMFTEIETLHERFLNYSFAIKENSPRTIAWHRDALKSLRRIVPIETAAELPRSNIEIWIMKGKTDHNWAAKTRRERIKSIGLFCNWLIQEEIFSKNPVDTIDLPKLPKRIPRHLPRDQGETLLMWAHNYPYHYAFERERGYSMIAMLLFTGIRKKELRSLELRDVDVENKVVFVRSGKGNKDRMIPMNDRLLLICRKYLKNREKMKAPSPYFFSPKNASGQLSEAVLNRFIEKIRAKSKIHFTPHLLRHTFVVLMLEGGCNLFALSKMMGHSDIKTTTIYLSDTSAHLQDQMRMHPLT